MATIELSDETVYIEALRRSQVKHALKTGLACCIATGLVHIFHLSAGQLAPVLTFLLFTTGMPSPRMNWLLTLVAVAINALGSVIILLLFHQTLFLYLALTLLWIFACLLFASWFPIPATLGAMVSAIGVFTFFHGTVGATLDFFGDYLLNFLAVGFAIVTVHTLIWPLNTPSIFAARLAHVYSQLELQCRNAAHWLRSGGPIATIPWDDWAPFRPLRQLLAPDLLRIRHTANPFARMILACRSLILRLWFLNRPCADMAADTLPTELRHQLADRLDRCALQLAALLDGALRYQPVPSASTDLASDAGGAVPEAATTSLRLAHGIRASIVGRLAKDLRIVTAAHNALFTDFGRGFGGALVARSVRIDNKLLDTQTVRNGAKLVIIILLLLFEQEWLGLPGGTQVAFYATFFASTANLGRQNKTDLVGVLGLLSGFSFGVVAAYLTSRLPHFTLLLALVFFGQFLADLAFQRFPRFSAAGLQAGLAIPFAFLATTGPEWGSFSTVRTRFAGLVVAGLTAIVVHAYVWPVLPMRQLRASIAGALRATAASIGELFASPSDWKGSPAMLSQTVTRARDLLDDAKFLPGSEHADPAYNGILGWLQEIDASLEYVHLLVGLEEEHSVRQRFFQAIGDFPEQATANLEVVARQFQDPPSRSVPIRWQPDAIGRWEKLSHDVGPVSAPNFVPERLVVIAGCLDQIASAGERISDIAYEINARGSRR
jgi:hypothetical protein